MTGGINGSLEKNKDRDVSGVEGKYMLFIEQRGRREVWERNYVSSMCGYT